MAARLDRVPTIIALLIVGVLVGVTVRTNIFTAWGTDPAAYIGAARRWSSGELFSPASLVFWAPWADGLTEAPLGHRAGPIKGTIVSEYPPGYPLLMAPAMRLDEDLAPHVVAPLLAGLLCWCVFQLASLLSGSWAGVLAAALVASSPVTVFHATQPMSDVPAAALWFSSVTLAVRAGPWTAAASGLSAAAAVTVRPNLAPLAVVVALVVLARSGEAARPRCQRTLIFVAVAAVGPALVLASQAALYGHPLTPGYAGYRDFFSAHRVPANATLYPALFIDMHSALPFAGLAMTAFAFAISRRGARSPAAVVSAGMVGFVLVNYALYLPYFTLPGWDSLRFLLPGIAALFVLFAGFLDRVRIVLATRSRMLAVLAVVPAIVAVLPARDEMQYVFSSAPAYRRALLMGRYLREAAPPNAAILTFLQSGAVSYYVGCAVVRLDLLQPASLDAVVDDLERHGYRPAFVIDDFMESDGFRARFQDSRFGKLDWAPRAQFASPTMIWYMETGDRERYLRGERWPIDTVRP